MNAAEVAAELVAEGVKAGSKAFGIVQTYGAVLEANVKRRASLPRTGPPGPRLITGNYVRSINTQMSIGFGNPTASVGTNAPQARRLELGFTGVDSLGRNYDQPPYPHFSPAFDEIEPAFIAAIAGII